MDNITEPLRILLDSGALAWCEQVDDNAFAITANGSYDALAEALSAIYDRTIWHAPGSLTCARGNLEPVFLFDRDKEENLLQARDCCLELDVWPSWAIGNMARKIVAELGRGVRLTGREQRLMKGAGIGYRQVKAGKYEHCDAYDVSGCYYQLLKRATSLSFDYDFGRIHWQETPAEQWSKWQEILGVIGPCKPLRNSIWGGLTGGTYQRQHLYFKNGQRYQKAFGPGPFHHLGLLVARSAYELCAEASIETDSVHSHTDSVIASNGRKPTAWQKVGLPVKHEASGPTVIQACGAYRCGNKFTKLWEPKASLRLDIEAPPRLDKLIYRQWL